ncbi:MAG: response regulator transcription factor [Chloroflexota bacterium]
MKILIVDSDPQVMDDLSVGLRLHWDDASILTAARAKDAVRIFYEHDPDLVVLDISGPDLPGLDLLRQLRRVSDAPIVVVSATVEETHEVRALELGADDYIVRPVRYRALIARIKAVLRRVGLQSPARTSPDFIAGDLAISYESHRVTVAGQPVKLTPIEYKVLVHLTRNVGRLMSHEALVDRVWGSESYHTPDNLKVFVSRLRTKIERGSRWHYIETERGLGYRFVRPKSAPSASFSPVLAAVPG